MPPSKQGEALGAMNGIRALTEGFGPLVFGFLMYMCQATRAPGAPYLLAGACSVAALYYSNRLPSEAELWAYEKEVLRSEVSSALVGGLTRVWCVGWCVWGVSLVGFTRRTHPSHSPTRIRQIQQGTGEAVGLLSEEGQKEEEEGEDEDEEEGGTLNRDEEQELVAPEASLPRPAKGKGGQKGKGKGEVEMKGKGEGEGARPDSSVSV